MKQEITIQQLNANDEHAKIIEWFVKNSEQVHTGQIIATIETSKTNVDLVSEFSGHILCHYETGDSLAIGASIATVYESLEEMQATKQIAPVVNKKPFIENKGKFSNAAIQYLNDNHLDPQDFTELGLVTVEKIKSHLSKIKLDKTIINYEMFPQGKIETLSYTKQKEIAILSKAKEGIIPSSLTIQFNSDELRQGLSKFPWLNGRILVYILYVFSRMLNEYPKFTAYFINNEIFLYNKVNVGVAIDLEKGLKVATLKDADKLSLFELQMSVIDCIAQYYENNFNSSSLSPSTVTVTDLSNDGILHFQPVLNANQSVILGIGGDHEFPGMPITLTIVFDHRILSGQEVASFLKRFKSKLLTEYALLSEI